MVIPLREHQIGDLALYIQHPRYANLSDPGTGKTAPTNVYMYYLWNDLKVRSLFLMPISLFRQNKESFFKFTNFTDEDIAIVHGTPKQRREIMATDAKVFIGSFNFFVPDKKTGLSNYDILREYHPDVNALCVDEIHMGFRSMDAKRTQYFLLALQSGLKYFKPLTGTPVDGRLDTAYPIISAIEPLYYYNYKTFLNEHAVYDYFGRICAWKNSRKVKEILKNHAVKHSFEEVYGKEAIVIEHDLVYMSPRQREFYDTYEEEQILDTGEEIKVAAHEAEAVLRLRQICNAPEMINQDLGELGKDERMEIHFEQALISKKPIVVYAAFNPEQERLHKLAQKIGLRSAIINGSVPVHKRDQISAAFQKGELDCIIASPATVGVGYDWMHVDYMVFYSMDYKDSSFVQGYRRAVRGKRSTPLLIYILCYHDSVEEDILAIMEGKMELANATDPTREIYALRMKRRKKSGVMGEMADAAERYRSNRFSKVAKADYGSA